MPKMKDEITQTLFGLAYIAHEPSNSRPPGFIGTAIIFLVDMIQLWRVLMQPAFGWTVETYNVAKYCDIVYVGSWLISMPLPRYALFLLAVVLSLALLGAVGWGSQTIKSGDLLNKNHAAMLRLVVYIFCHVLFTSIISWLLIPVECTQPTQVLNVLPLISLEYKNIRDKVSYLQQRRSSMRLYEHSIYGC